MYRDQQNTGDNVISKQKEKKLINGIDIDQRISEFVDYCWSFYGPEGLHPEVFDGQLSKSDLEAVAPNFWAFIINSIDGDLEVTSEYREIARDILIKLKELDTVTNPFLALLQRSEYGLKDRNTGEIIDTDKDPKGVSNLEHYKTVEAFLEYIEENNIDLVQEEIPTLTLEFQETGKTVELPLLKTSENYNPLKLIVSKDKLKRKIVLETVKFITQNTELTKKEAQELLAENSNLAGQHLKLVK